VWRFPSTRSSPTATRPVSGVVRLKRIYEPAEARDGMRVLVDRLWPRGVSKAHAAINLWLKEAAPSPGLRRWFGHRADRWPEFRRRYQAELAHNPAVAQLRDLAGQSDLTLLYAARNKTHNHALVLAGQFVAAG
jgi:uncharacterized protein YeaO (DUF488 family)